MKKEKEILHAGRQFEGYCLIFHYPVYNTPTKPNSKSKLTFVTI